MTFWPNVEFCSVFFVLKETMSCVNRCCLVVCSWLNCTFVWKNKWIENDLGEGLGWSDPSESHDLAGVVLKCELLVRNCQISQVAQFLWCTCSVSGFAGGVSCARKPNVKNRRICVLQINSHPRDSQKLGWHQLEGSVYLSFFTFILSSFSFGVCLQRVFGSGKDLGAKCHVSFLGFLGANWLFRLRKGSFRGSSTFAPHIRFVPPTETLCFFSTFVFSQSPAAKWRQQWLYIALQKRVGTWNTCLHFVCQVFFPD